jgi:hypothetical protein
MRFLNKQHGDESMTDWLAVIHHVNATRTAAGAEPLFGRPTHAGPWWAGGSVEEYERANVILREDGTVNIEGKDEEATRLIEEAATALGV